ncbi:MAG: hypothetical protein N4A46_01285, partial [Schleiferiaceae bacterium]|nr:hypothetical protein [Schleiferiaceae bacterium]
MNYLKPSNFLSIPILFLLVSCSGTTAYVQNVETKYGEISILAQESKKAETVILFVPEDDTMSIARQVELLSPLLSKKTSLYAFPKFMYKQPVIKDNADNPKLRLELLVTAYQQIIEDQKFDSSATIKVLGLSEGALISPHFARLIRADELLLINPLYHSYKENLTVAFTEPTANSKKLISTLGFYRTEDWQYFLRDVETKTNPDKSAGSRTYRYYSSYWNYYPGEYYGHEQILTKMIIFKDYVFSSDSEKEFL